MAIAQSASINGGLVVEPPVGSKAEPLVGGHGGKAPLKLKGFLLIFIHKVAQS